jgi:hypothetical protein
VAFTGRGSLIKVKCWAMSLGDCSGGQSAEHLVSNVVFSGGSVEVTGKIWNARQPLTIGQKAFTANILCRGHNSRLSPVDTAEGKATKAIGDFIGSQERRRKSVALVTSSRHTEWMARSSSASCSRPYSTSLSRRMVVSAGSVIAHTMIHRPTESAESSTDVGDHLERISAPPGPCRSRSRE